MQGKKKYALIGGVLLALGVWGVVDYQRYKSRTNAHAVWAWAVTRIFQLSNPNSDVVLDTTELKAMPPGPYNRKAFLNPADLPARAGPRPRMVRGVPHRQVDQHAPKAVREAMDKRLASLEDFSAQGDAKAALIYRASLWELTGARALILKNCAPSNCHPSMARTKGEFTHLHSHGGSYHMVLAVPDLITVIEKGWGEKFPIAGWLGGRIPYVALVYAPRDAAEFRAFRGILRASYRFATTPLKDSKNK